MCHEILDQARCHASRPHAVVPWLNSSLLRTLRPIFGPSLAPVLHTSGVQGPTNHMIADAGEILDASAADQDDRMFLEVVPDTRNIRGHLDAIREADTGHLAQRRIGFFWRRGVYPHAHPSLLGI